jgi:hypothetical protein
MPGSPRLFNDEPCGVAEISPGEQAERNDTADQLSDTIEAAAKKRGFTYVDPRAAFQGHAICDDVRWVNGLSVPFHESYHPNESGHDTFTTRIEARW